MMYYDADEDELVFASGKRLYVHDGTIGISPDLTRLGYGADGPINWPKEWNEFATQLTVSDIAELADHMIERWQKFRASLPVTTGQ